MYNNLQPTTTCQSHTEVILSCSKEGMSYRQEIQSRKSLKIPKGSSEGHQKPQIEEGQTTQWPKDTKEVIRSRELKKDRQYNGQKIPKGSSEAVS